MDNSCNVREDRHMKKIPLALGLFFVGLSHAQNAQDVVNFSGSWGGTGQMVSKSPWTGNKTEACRSIEIRIKQSADTLSIERYRGVCGMLDSDWGPLTMQLRDSKLWDPEEPDHQVGVIEGNILKATFSGGAAYAFNIRLNPPASQGAKPTLDSYYGVQNAFGTIVIEGRLNDVSAFDAE